MKATKGIGGHESTNSRTDEWLTDPRILHPLGQFDLDPCSPINRPWDTALKHYTKLDNGLLLPWFGRVWCNPPYGTQLALWLKKMGEHMNGIALTFARTDTQAFQRHVFPHADSILFIEKRLVFWTSAGSKAMRMAGAPSVLIGYGEENVDILEDSGIKGKHISLNSVPMIVVGIHHTWKAIVTVALTRIGSEAQLQRVYDIVAQISPDRVTANKHYKEKIRQTLQQNFRRVRKGTYIIDLQENNN